MEAMRMLKTCRSENASFVLRTMMQLGLYSHPVLRAGPMPTNSVGVECGRTETTLAVTGVLFVEQTTQFRRNFYNVKGLLLQRSGGFKFVIILFPLRDAADIGHLCVLTLLEGFAVQVIGVPSPMALINFVPSDCHHLNQTFHKH